MTHDALFAALCLASGALLTLALTPPCVPQPPLIGYGCEGAHGALMAYNESDFPQCAVIERNN